MALRLLANENIPRAAVEMLRESGHDVVWVRDAMAGANDESIMARANADDRLILTFDRDYGELAFRRQGASAPGILPFRIPMATPERLAGQILSAVNSRTDWANMFSVIDEHRIRMVPLRRSE